MTPTPAVSLTTDAVPVLDQHRFDEARLEHYLLDHVEGFTTPVKVEQTQGGMSNPTFWADTADRAKAIKAATSSNSGAAPLP